ERTVGMKLTNGYRPTAATLNARELSVARRRRSPTRHGAGAREGRRVESPGWGVYFSNTFGCHGPARAFASKISKLNTKSPRCSAATATNAWSEYVAIVSE